VHRSNPIICATLLLMATSRASAATPINACGIVIMQSGSYVVTRNLTIKKGSVNPCIAVAANYIAIDLGGFTIDCQTANATGIMAKSPLISGLIVRNGVITNCGSDGFAGLETRQETGVLVAGVLAVGNVVDGIAGNNGIVLRSISNNNSGGVGVDLGCPSVVMDTTALDNMSNFNLTCATVLNILGQ
jgi:hypothetical protein